MKAFDFVQALNDVDDKYIREAVEYKKPNSSLKFWRVVAIAACICLAATLGLTLSQLNSGISSDTAAGSGQRNDAGAGRFSEVAYNAGAEDSLSYKAAAYEMDMPEEAVEEAYFMEDYEVPAPTYAQAEAADDSWYDEDRAMMDIAGDARMEETREEQAGSKIIYTVYMDMETTGFDAAILDLNSLVDTFGGYLESENVSNRSGSYRDANYVIRIPAENLNAFLEQAGDICTVTNMSRNAEDVSESYYDIASRLETARTKLARLQELLEEAENMEDIISLEAAISDTQWEIDHYGSSLKYYDGRVSYSTITAHVREVYEVVVEETPMSFGERIGQSFQQGVREFGNFLKALFLWIINNWIWLMIIGIIIVVVIVLIRRGIRKRKNK